MGLLRTSRSPLNFLYFFQDILVLGIYLYLRTQFSGGCFMVDQIISGGFFWLEHLFHKVLGVQDTYLSPYLTSYLSVCNEIPPAI